MQEFDPISNSSFSQDLVLDSNDSSPPLTTTPSSITSDSMVSTVPGSISSSLVQSHSRPPSVEFSEISIDAFLAPKTALNRSLRTDVVNSTGWTNSWTLSPEFLKALLTIPWPHEKSFFWFKDLYPSDFDSSSPQEGRSVFRRRFFTRPCISNPPYDPQRETPDGRCLTLLHHVSHLVQCARNGQVEHIIVLPLRQSSVWYSWLEVQPDVALIHIEGRCSFRRGPLEQTSGPAPFDSLLVLVGANNSVTTAKYTLGRFQFNSDWLRSVKWVFTGWSPQLFGHIAPPKFSTWEDFYNQALSLTKKRVQLTPVCEYQTIPKLTVDLPFVAPLSNRTAFQTLMEHTAPFVADLPKQFSPAQAESYRLTHDQRFRNRAIVPCSHCHKSDHLTSECWRTSSKALIPIYSDRLRALVKSLYRTKFISTWSLPTRDSSMSLGSYLVDRLFPAFLQRGRYVWNKIHPTGSPDLTGMYDGQFSLIQQRAYMWLLVDAPKHVVSQILTGFAPRWIDAEHPERIFVSSQNPFVSKARLDVQSRDSDHENAGRITRIPRDQTHHYVWSTAARFPIYQLQDDLSQKLRIIFNARIFNFRLPERKFTLPTVRALHGELIGWFISIDLSKAYFQFPLEWNSRRFFGAAFADSSQEYFLFNSWPFGVSSAPSLCQFLVMFVVRWIQKVTGWLVRVYLDDFLLRIATEDNIDPRELARRVEFVRAVFEALGLIVNAKSCLVPAKELKWLGWYLNSEFHQAFGSKSKMYKFKNLAMTLANRDTATIQELQSIKGLFAFFSTSHNRFLARPIDFTLTEAFKDLGLVNPTKDDFARYAKRVISLPKQTQVLFQVWGQEILSSLSLTSMSISPVRQVVVVCDASEEFGGFFVLRPDTVTPTLSHLSPNSELESLPKCDLTTLSLPTFARVRQIGLLSNQPASYTRECVILLNAVRSVLPSLDSTPTLVSVLTDNQGLATSFAKIKPRTPALFNAVANFRSILPVNVTIKVEWQPRETPLAKLADQLSKVGRMFLTARGRTFLQSRLPFLPPVLIDPRRLLLTSRHWVRKFHNSPQIFLIHPCTFKIEIETMFALFSTFQAQGLVISPLVPSQFTGNIITKVSSKSPYFHFDFNPTSSMLFILSLCPKISPTM